MKVRPRASAGAKPQPKPANFTAQRNTLDRTLRAIRQRFFNSASGIALLWVGWVVLVFQTVLWFMTADIDLEARRWEALIIMALLSQSAIVTGVGLAVLERAPMPVRGDARTSRAAPSGLATPQENGPEPARETQVLPPPPAPTWQRPVVTMGSGRAARLFSDGSIEIETKLGRRRFSSTVDAVRFVGPGALSPSALH